MGINCFIQFIKLYNYIFPLTSFSFFKNFIKNVESNPGSFGNQNPIYKIISIIMHMIHLPFWRQKLNLSSLCLNFFINSDTFIFIISCWIFWGSSIRYGYFFRLDINNFFDSNFCYVTICYINFYNKYYFIY